MPKLPRRAGIDGTLLVQRINEAGDLPEKAERLWSLPTQERHAALGALDPETIAALIETNPSENTALLGNLPSEKFTEIVNLGSPEQGCHWLARAVSTRMLAAQMLPALLSSRDLMLMLMTSVEYRMSLSGLLNFRRAEEMRSLLHPLEWKNSIDDLLLADAEELLRKAPIRERSVRFDPAILDRFLFGAVSRSHSAVAGIRRVSRRSQRRACRYVGDAVLYARVPDGRTGYHSPGGPGFARSDAAPTLRQRPERIGDPAYPNRRRSILADGDSRLPVDRRDQLEAG